MILMDKYDAWACMTCNKWKDKACNDPQCQFCSNRPETPYEVYWNHEAEINSSLERKKWRRSNYQHKKAGEQRRANKWNRKE